VLLIVLVSFASAALGLAAVAKVAHIAVGRLGLEPMSVLLFFGLAEAPADDLAVRRAAPVATRRPVRSA